VFKAQHWWKVNIRIWAVSNLYNSCRWWNHCALFFCALRLEQLTCMTICESGLNAKKICKIDMTQANSASSFHRSDEMLTWSSFCLKSKQITHNSVQRGMARLSWSVLVIYCWLCVNWYRAAGAAKDSEWSWYHGSVLQCSLGCTSYQECILGSPWSGNWALCIISWTLQSCRILTVLYNTSMSACQALSLHNAHHHHHHHHHHHRCILDAGCSYPLCPDRWFRFGVPLWSCIWPVHPSRMYQVCFHKLSHWMLLLLPLVMSSKVSRLWQQNCSFWSPVLMVMLQALVLSPCV